MRKYTRPSDPPLPVCRVRFLRVLTFPFYDLRLRQDSDSCSSSHPYMRLAVPRNANTRQRKHAASRCDCSAYLNALGGLRFSLSCEVRFFESFSRLLREYPLRLRRVSALNTRLHSLLMSGYKSDMTFVPNGRDVRWICQN